MVVKKDGEIFRGLSKKDGFTVLANLTPDTKDLQFFVVSTFQLNGWLVSDFENWVRTPGKNGRPHDPSTRSAI